PQNTPVREVGPDPSSARAKTTTVAPVAGDDRSCSRTAQSAIARAILIRAMEHVPLADERNRGCAHHLGAPPGDTGGVRLPIMVVIAALTAGVAHADRLSPEDLARKDERGYITGLPLFSYSTDIGFGGGARAYYYWNGTRDDERFTQTPYLHRIFLQGFASTRGIQFHWLDYVAPRIFGTPYRIRSQLIFSRNINSNYFGHGDAALAPLAFPGAPGTTYDSYADYTAAQQRVTGGVAYTKYDQYDLIRPVFVASVERLALGDRVRILGGYGFTYASIRDYTGKQVDAIDDTGAQVQATSAPTRYREDCDAGRLVGCGGGREGFLRLGISYDTRDFEPDPNRGVFADVALDAATVALGSEYSYARLLGAARG